MATYWRANFTLRQLVSLFGESKSYAGRVIDRLGPKLALRQRERFAKDAALIVDGTLVPTRDHIVAEQSKNYRYSTNHQVVIDADSRFVVVAGRFPATAMTARHGSSGLGTAVAAATARQHRTILASAGASQQSPSRSLPSLPTVRDS